MSTVVVVYATHVCPYCRRALALLDQKGVQPHIFWVDRQPELRTEMQRRSGRHTVPQIFVGDRHLGGCDDLYELDRQGELDSLLR